MAISLLWRISWRTSAYLTTIKVSQQIFQNPPKSLVLLLFYILGAIAQLVEHLHGMQGVSGSSPLGSILQKEHLLILDLIGGIMLLPHL